MEEIGIDAADSGVDLKGVWECLEKREEILELSL